MYWFSLFSSNLFLSFSIAKLDSKLGRMTRSCSSWFHWVRQRWVWVSIFFWVRRNTEILQSFHFFYLPTLKYILVQNDFLNSGKSGRRRRKQRHQIESNLLSVLMISVLQQVLGATMEAHASDGLVLKGWLFLLSVPSIHSISIFFHSFFFFFIFQLFFNLSYPLSLGCFEFLEELTAEGLLFVSGKPHRW